MSTGTNVPGRPPRYTASSQETCLYRSTFISLRGIGNVFRPRAALRYRLRRANAAAWLQGELRLVQDMESRHD
ncbi:hypothetical protein PDENDC454_19478 [Paenibacillus dendritiformis C454]|uniref:Uncharacterized protein n=1 Tax=Paenibacillus dendritiformis C454 TaxID=1131935 RepID=H3SK18_9BACL|nr:hypothetical protein PDENDC454_19478 [Paenibacillus dendritiformis C454]